jgi:hypothetical protein
MSETPISTLIYESVRENLGAQGNMVTGMVAVTTYLNPDGVRCWAWSVDPNQGPEVTLGLARVVETVSTTVAMQSFSVGIGEANNDD